LGAKCQYLLKSPGVGKPNMGGGGGGGGGNIV
jgi:hypothetical protein